MTDGETSGLPMTAGIQDGAPSGPALEGHVIICGFGHIGYRIASLLAELGERGAVIAKEMKDDWRRAVEPAFTAIHGDGCDDALLHLARIGKAKAIIAATDDDMANVSIALDARRLNSEAMIVVRLFDQSLGLQLGRSMKNVRFLSSSAIAAPSFVAAALGETVKACFLADDGHCVLEEATASPADAGSSVDDFARRRGLSVASLSRGGLFLPNPKGGEILQPGDSLLCFRMEEAAQSRTEKRRKFFLLRLSGDCVDWAREWWSGIPGILRLFILALAIVISVSVALIDYSMKIPALDAFYFVVTTITTVGYGDYNFMNAAWGMKVFGCFLMVCGAGLIAMIFSLTTDLLLKTRFRDVSNRRCAKYRGHIVVAGLGTIGYRIAKELIASGETVVAVEQNDAGEFVKASREVVPVLIGNARNPETLTQAGIEGAKAIVAATDDDLANLSASLAAKRFNGGCRTVVRIFDASLAGKIQGSFEIDAVLSASSASAPAFVGAALSPETLHGLVMPGGLLLVFRRKMESRLELEDGESALFCKRSGQRRFVRFSPSVGLQPGDEIIGLKWRPFQVKGEA